MFATVEVTQAVESFDQQTVGMMMTDMLETVTALGIIEALVLDLLAMRNRACGPTVEEGKFVSQ